MGNSPASHASGARRERRVMSLALVVLASCTTSVAPVRHVAQSPHPTPAAKVCTDDLEPKSVLIADWPEPLRNELFAAMDRGSAFVKLSCDGIAIVRSCSSPGRYDEVSVGLADERSWQTTIVDAGSLLPLRGRAIERSIDGGGTIALASRDKVVRSLAVPADGSPVVTEDELIGGCDGVTHVVTRVHFGAVAMAARTSDATWPDVIDAPMPEGFSPLLKAPHAPFAIDVVPVSRRRVVDARSSATPLGDPTSKTEGSDRTSACERGSAVDCTLIAGGSQERLERACHLGDPAGCERAGVALLSTNGDTSRADRVSTAIALLERACIARDAMACARAGAELDTGKRAQRDAPRAARLLTRACREGDAPSCVRAGTMLGKGDGVERDDARANELLERACNVGDGYRKACFDLARRVASGQGGLPDLRRAAELYLRGCAPPESTEETEEGNHSCSRAGSMYETGDGVKKDFDRGMTLHLLACRRTGDKRSCFAAGNWLEKRSRGRGMALYQEVCRKFQLKEACQRSH